MKHDPNKKTMPLRRLPNFWKAPKEMVDSQKNKGTKNEQSKRNLLQVFEQTRYVW